MNALCFLIFLILLSLFSVIIRLSTRLHLCSLGLDDALICLAFGMSCIVYSCGILAELQSRKNTSQAPDDFFALWLSIPFCQSTLIICKLSLLAFYQRIFTRRSVKRFGHFIATILIMCGVWIFFSSIFFCNPVSYFWTHGPTAKKHCLPWKILWTLNGSIQIVSYLAILIVPLMVLPGLCLAKGQKIGLLSLFGLNLLLACAGMIHSVVTFKRFLSGNFTLVNANQDLVYSSSDATLSIVCACMPACYPVFRWIVTRLIVQNIPQKFKVFKEPTVSRNINLTSPIDDDSTFVASGHMYAASVQVTEGGGYHNKRQVGVIEVKRSVDIISQGDMGE